MIDKPSSHLLQGRIKLPVLKVFFRVIHAAAATRTKMQVIAELPYRIHAILDGAFNILILDPVTDTNKHSRFLFNSS
ncbi:MAG: hypothetical protein ACREVY_15260 [Gammaproteobacteria bacterium]